MQRDFKTRISTIEECSLKLPYDYSRTSYTSFLPGDVHKTFPIKGLNDTDSTGEDSQWAFILAGVVSLFYRYCGHSNIPLNLTLQSPNGRRKSCYLTTPTKGSLSFPEIQRSFAEAICNNAQNYDDQAQVSVTLKNFDFNSIALVEDTNAEPVESDIHFEIELLTNEIGVDCRFNSSLFKQATVNRLLKHLSNLWGSALEKPAILLKDLAMFSEEDIQWYHEVSTGPQRIFSETWVHKEIEAHAITHPDKIAVTKGDQYLTYKMLNERANKLSHLLLSKGIGAESRIIVGFEPCTDVIVALLAIFKVGATYVPINPAHPDYRILTIIEDTDPALILSRSNITLPAAEDGAESLFLDDEELLVNESLSNPNQSIDSEQTAYIYYTSGTTGKPKGSMGSYANLNHYIKSAQEQYGFSIQEIMPSLASYTFSISMFELMSPLVAGGELKLMERQHILDVSLMTKTLQHITFIHAGPSLLKTLVKYIKEEVREFHLFNNIRHISSGGDMIPADLLRDLQEIFTKAEIYVIYGCSEIACMGCTQFIPHDQQVEKTYVGKPFYNMSMVLLDPDGNLAPVGATGEVCFSGNGLAKGYLNRPELTSEKFFNYRESRFYRTGDVGKLHSSGALELLGRSDFQVQIRGMRVELGEVEYHLRQIPGVRDGAVVARHYQALDNVLVGFYITDGTTKITSDLLRDHIATYVPDYMVPPIYVELDALPLNINMKVDRKKLASIKIATSVSETPVVPLDENQKKIFEIWAKVLGHHDFGLTDNFFVLGGHSLLLTQVINKVRTTFNVMLSIERIFEDPTILRFSEEVLAGNGIADQETSTISHHPRSIEEVDIFPCSYQQQQLWLLHKMNPASAAYNIPFAFQLKGPLNHQVLRKSLQKIVDENESFRSTFKYLDGEVFQQIHDHCVTDIPLEVIVSENEVQEYIQKFKLTPFDLENGPLLKMEVLKQGPLDHLLLVNFHHIIIDQISILHFTDTLSKLYEDLLEERPLERDGLKLQYADYVFWSKEQKQQDSLKEKLSFWQQSLQGHSFNLELPYDNSRDHQQNTNQGIELPVKVPKKLSQKVLSLRKLEKKSGFVFCLTALNVLISKLSNSYDLIVGCPFANRNHPGLENIVGCLMNTLPIRTVFSPNDSFVEVMDKVQIQALKAQGHQEVAFEQIVQAVKPERLAGSNPIFQVSFIFQDPPMEIQLKDISSTSYHLHSDTSKFDFTLWLWEGANGLQGLLEYNSRLFKADTIQRFWANFLNLLESVVDNPHGAIQDHSIITDEEQAWLNKANDTFMQVPQYGLHKLFEQQVAKATNALALTLPHTGSQVTYLELNEKANRLAHLLLTMGVKPQSKIGICVDRNVHMITGLIAILKIGGTYVPMDPFFPEERVQYMVDDSAIKFVLTEEKYLSRFDEKLDLLALDTITDTLAKQEKSNPNVDTAKSDLAYVIYTSGSTGKPKGVQISHGAVVNFLNSMARGAPGFSTAEKLLAVTTISFDISVLELFLPLICGGQIVLATREESQDGVKLSQILTTYDIDVMQATPTTWQLLRVSGWEGKSTLRILCGGEALPYDLKEDLVEKCSELWNMYGPTETTVWSSVKKLTEGNPITIGKPIGNTTFKLVDPQGTQVPCGVNGELLIGGAGLAAGYLNRPELTNEKFINLPDGTYYRTGDEARYLPNGEFEVLGRLDFQVKLRGYRIELGEIESAISALSSIKQSVVILGVDHLGNKRLISYYVSEQEVPQAQIKDHLRKQLPEYMIPSTLVRLERFPLTPNKKIDRKALPTESHVEGSISKRLAETELEKKMATLWHEVLGVKSIGVDEDFFDLGGHSILAARLFQLIKQQFNVDLPLGILFESPTISLLTKHITHSSDEQHWKSLVPIKPSGSRKPLFLVHGAGGNVLLYKDLADSLPEDQPLYGLQSLLVRNQEVFEPSFEQMAEFYIKEIQEVQPHGPYLLGGYCMGGAIAFEMARQLTEKGEKIAFVAMLETYNIQCFQSNNFSKWIKKIHSLQSVWFHLQNIWSLSGEARLTFLKRKWQAQKIRTMLRFQAIIGRKSQDQLLEGDYQTTNDMIHEKYQPKAFDGKILLYKGSSNFYKFNDRYYLWGPLVNDKIDVRKLMVKPRGMLTSPFVKQLVQDLETEIIKAN